MVSTLPSLMFDTTILENGTIKIPELKNMQQHDVHVIIVFKPNKETNTRTKNLAGSLNNYAKPELIEKETDNAWSNIKDN